ncbi:hypothetical protein ACFWWT_20875 [Streptomyces sp. NPDC058676]|uniref:hypothetical protein n=1 Tax=unclassified Streptomyces TaxID=2593676 RepID=UPI0036696102
MSAEALRMPGSPFGGGRVHAVAGCRFVPSVAAPGLAALEVHSAFRNRPRAGLAFGFVCTAVGLAGPGVTRSLPALIAVRLPLGAGLALGQVCLRVLAADRARGRAPGGLSGALESLSEAGAVAAGTAAAAGSARFGPAASVRTGGAAAFAVLAVTRPPLKFRTRWSR